MENKYKEEFGEMLKVTIGLGGLMGQDKRKIAMANYASLLEMMEKTKNPIYKDMINEITCLGFERFLEKYDMEDALEIWKTL